MKKFYKIGLLAFAALALVSCGSSKKVSQPESRVEKATSLEGENVVVETVKMTGIEMVDALSEDGTKMIKVPYKWYAGIGKANDKQTAIEMAELEARATVSRVVENIVLTEAERGSLVNNGDVQKALKSYWSQMSLSIQNACEPFGDTKIEYSPTTRMYTVTGKVGMRGDKFQQMLNNAGNYKPKGLSGKDLEDFQSVNKSIIDAAKK